MDIHESLADCAAALFLQGYNCSQSVLGVFAKDAGLTAESAFRLASGFGGGMGRMREVCGAVSGMFMAAGLMFGYSQPETGIVKATLYSRIQELAAAFKKENGSIICRELLAGSAAAFAATQTDSMPESRTAEYYKKRPCKELVACAARIFSEYLQTHQAEISVTGIGAATDSVVPAIVVQTVSKGEKNE